MFNVLKIKRPLVFLQCTLRWKFKRSKLPFCMYANSKPWIFTELHMDYNRFYLVQKMRALRETSRQPRGWRNCPTSYPQKHSIDRALGFHILKSGCFCWSAATAWRGIRALQNYRGDTANITNITQSRLVSVILLMNSQWPSRYYKL